MKILILYLNENLVHGAAAKRIESFCKFLPRFGHDVTLITNKDIANAIFSNEKYKKSFQPDFNIEAITFSETEKSSTKKISTIISRLIHTINEEKIQIIICSGGPFYQFIFAYISAAYCRIHLILDYRDPWLNNPYGSPSLKYKIVKPILSFIEFLMIKKSSFISVASPGIENFLTSKPRITKFIPNGYDPTLYKERDLTHDSKRHRDENRTLNFLYTGSVSLPHYPFERILNTISNTIRFYESKRLQIKINLDIIGIVSDEYKILIENYEHESNFTINLHGHKPPEYVATYQCKSDYCLLLIAPTENYEKIATYDISTKLYEYIGAHADIIGIVPKYGPASKIIQEYKRGLILDPLNNDAFNAELLFNYIYKKNTCESQPNDEVTVKKYTREHSVKELNSAINLHCT